MGGTFTDCIGRTADGTLITHKLLSSGLYRGRIAEGSSPICILDPGRGSDPPNYFRGFRFSLLKTRGDDAVDETAVVTAFDPQRGRMELDRPLKTKPAPGMVYELSCGDEAPILGVRWLAGKTLTEAIGPVHIRLGTTRGTNALLERKGAPTVFVTTRGFGDLLTIGDQTRPKLFDLHIRKSTPLHQDVIELNERISADGEILIPLDPHEVREKLLAAKQRGNRALAICLMNSYRNPAHEQLVEDLARTIDFEAVSTSNRLSPLQGMLARSETAVINAYLEPVIRRYVEDIRATAPDAMMAWMTSSGGLVKVANFAAKDSILSGPAGGVVGCAAVARQAGFEKAIGFDMGGTSTDVSRFDGEYERRYEMILEDRETEGRLRIAAPMLVVETVAAGGGSICDFDGIKPIVGPRSAGAAPGPACYGRGGPLCLTDVNFFLGRITQDNFPFPLDTGSVEERLDALRAQVKAKTKRQYSREELATGYIAIANAHMVGAIRKISTRRGYDPREYALVSFGGAGGQHACAIARELGMHHIILPGHAGVLSAYGIGMAEITKFSASDVGEILTPEALTELNHWFAKVESELRLELEKEGFPDNEIAPAKRMLDLRYEGQDATTTLEQPENGDWRQAFERKHRQQYGFIFQDRPIEIHAARLEVSSRTFHSAQTKEMPPSSSITASRFSNVFFDGAYRKTPVYDRRTLQPGDAIEGPAMVLDATSTVIIESNWTAQSNPNGDLVMQYAGSPVDPRACSALSISGGASSEDYDPVTLELFNNLLGEIAEQMGAMLQRTALSTNVKERLDFSCAIFDAEGNLVSHAPHIPVHLGSMSDCVKCLIEDVPAMRAGEVFVTNDPYRGGTHLPDITVITPVFDEHGKAIRFFTASRAHHAEIGGITPGSMPSQSRNLAEEGVLLRAVRLIESDSCEDTVNGGVRIRPDELRQLLVGEPHPSRDVDQNIADIQAQIAANRRGVQLLQNMMDHHGLNAVQTYMRHIQKAAETKMRTTLHRLPKRTYNFTDALDDGSKIAVRITVKEEEAVVDFTGTGPILPGNLNATPAIVTSAVLYCFRCLINEDIPLNAGVLAPVRILLPNCFLNPNKHEDPLQCAAVAGGNVETSQRIVDAIFGALEVVAAGQGTMNNLSFGNQQFGYYETICGGAGAGPGFNGAGAVHTHMTNTRLTDPEVLENRYPVRLQRFAVRRGSGGEGRWRGGDGVIREIEFLDSLEVSLLTQRRARPPYGLAGGQPGRVGRNSIRRTKPDGEEVEELPSICSFSVTTGDILTLETPGGGGYG